MVRAPNWVGDLVMATPVLAAAVERPGDGPLWILLRGHLAPLLEDGPLGPHLLPVRGSAEERAAYRALAPERVLLLPNSLGAAWRAFRAGVPTRVGTDLGLRRLLLTDPLATPRRAGRREPLATASLYLELGAKLGWVPADPRPRLWAGETSREEVRGVLADAGLSPDAPYLVVAPGAAFGSAKLWPAGHFAAAARAIAEPRGWRVCVVGAPSEAEQVARVAQGIGPLAATPRLGPRGLALLSPLIAGARLLLVGDSGPRWIAAAWDVPCVSLMGPNAPELTATSLERAAIVRREDLPCSPCLERRCPLGHHRCLAELPPERAVAAAERLLSSPAPVPPRSLPRPT